MNYLVAAALLVNGSNEISIRLAAFKFSSFICFPSAEINPPDRRRDPVNGIDMIYLSKWYFSMPFLWLSYLTQSNSNTSAQAIQRYIGC